MNTIIYTHGDDEYMHCVDILPFGALLVLTCMPATHATAAAALILLFAVCYGVTQFTLSDTAAVLRCMLLRPYSATCQSMHGTDRECQLH